MPFLNLKILFRMIGSEVCLSMRSYAQLLNALAFFLLVNLLFTIATGNSEGLLRQIGPGIVWTSALLSILMSLDSLFKPEYQEGILAKFILQPCSLGCYVVVKLLIHACSIIVPLLLLTILASLMYHLSLQEAIILELSLLLGMPSIIFIGALFSALTLSLNNRSIMLFILIIPLVLPIIIFGTGSVNSVLIGSNPTGLLMLLCAILVLCLSLCPGAIAYALRISHS